MRRAIAFYYKKQAVIISCVLMLLSVMIPSVAWAADTVESIEVSIETQGDATLAEPVEHRMQASVATIADSLLIGKRVAELDAQRDGYEAIVSDVLGRILTGYTVNRVTIEAGEVTRIVAEVKPWGNTIRTVRVETDFAGVSAHVESYLKKHMADYERTIANILVGLSTDAIDWAQAIAKRSVNEQLADDLPEFKVGFDVDGGQDTVVKLTFLPQGAVVKTVSVDLSSMTIPHLVLWELRPRLEYAVSDLVGLPVDYVARQQDFLCEAAKSELEQRYPFIRRHGIVITPTMNVGTNTEIKLQVETTRYRMQLEGYLEMGKKEDNASFKLHSGYFMTPRQEAFLDIAFSAGDVRWEFLPGWSYYANDKTWLGLKYNINESQEWLFVEETLGKRWRLRGEICPSSGDTEIGLRYRLHELFSVEYVVREDDKWIRLIGNL